MPIAGWDIRCPRGDPGGLVSNIGAETMGKGRKGNQHTRGGGQSIGQLGRQAGGPKEGRKAAGGCRYPLGKEKPVGVSLRAVVMDSGLSTVAG